MATRCWLHGYSGRMGSEIRQLIDSDSSTWELLGGTVSGKIFDQETKKYFSDWHNLPTYLERVDLIIDFSSAEANRLLHDIISVNNCHKKALLVGTTGLTNTAKSMWKHLAEKKDLRLLFAPNTSLGILLTLKISEMAAKILSPLGFDIELVESHHRHKIDIPSGTAKFLAESVAQSVDKITNYNRTGKRLNHEIGIASIRGGSVFGEHELKFLGDNEELTITHKALSRSLFAQGALLLASWLLMQKPGIYQLEDITIEDMVTLLKKET